MIDSLEPEFPWFTAWWRRQHVAVRIVLSPFLLVTMTVLLILVFVSIITWLPIVHAIGELIDSR